MTIKRLLMISFIFVIMQAFVPQIAEARHEGFYFGGHYQQPILFTWKRQSTIAPNPGGHIRFWPGFGFDAIIGYEFEKVEWLGIALPLTWGMMKLDGAEWVHLINADAQVIFHLSRPEKKFDPYITILAGFNFLSEGSIKNQSQSIGPDVGVGLGFNYTLMEYAKAGSPNVTNLSLNVEVPFKFILFVNDEDLSDSKTTPIMHMPIKIGMTYSF